MTGKPIEYSVIAVDQRLDAKKLDDALVPKLVTEWVCLMGVGPTMALVNHYPGMQIKVPKGFVGGLMKQRLERILGHQAAEAFITRYGGEHLTVPRCAGLMRSLRNAEIIAAYDRGETLNELALAYGLSVRQLRQVLNSPTATTTAAPAAPRRLGRLGDGNPNQFHLIPPATLTLES